MTLYTICQIFTFLIYFLIGVKLFKNVSVSAVQKLESSKQVYKYPLFLEPPFHPHHPTLIGLHRAPSCSPCTIQKPPTGYFMVCCNAGVIMD